MRFSTSALMRAKLQAIHDESLHTTAFGTGLEHGAAVAAPVALRPDDGRDLDRGVWDREANGRPVWRRYQPCVNAGPIMQRRPE